MSRRNASKKPASPFAKKQQAFAKHLWDSGMIPRNSAAYNQALSIGHRPETPEKDRARLIQEYNEGKSPVLLVSGAGSEGLDLKGTKLVQLMEPTWNNSKLDQVIGRGVRYKSHEHLPEDEREVRVQRYFSAFPKTLGNRLHLTKPDKTVERYLYDMSNQKSELANQMLAALQEASDRGPIKKKAPLGGVATAG